MARKALGRGLDALLPERRAEDPGTFKTEEVDIDLVRPNPRQPREKFDDAALESMADSLRDRGMLQPVVVRRATEGYEIIAGERRWRAAQRAGWSRVPVVVREATPLEALELAVVENVQREDLNPVEEARAYEMLVQEGDLTQEEVAERVGRDRSTVANYLRLLRLPEAVQQYLVDGRLGMGHARALLGLEEGAAAQKRLAEEIVKKGLSVRQTERRVRSENAPEAGVRTPEGRDPDTVAAEERLARSLGTKVRIQGQERGRIEIRFSSLEELERLYELLLSKKGA